MTERNDRDGGEAVHGARSNDGVSRDRELLKGVQRRDREALGRFFDAVFPFVYNLSYRLTGRRSSAEDVAQEVFLKVYRAADRLDPDRSPYPWLTAITTNVCRDLGRRAATRAEEPLDDTLYNAPEGDPHATPDEALLRKEEARMLDQALRSLDEPQRTVVILHDYCGSSHEEIASIVDASPAAVRKRYSRALEALRAYIRKWER